MTKSRWAHWSRGTEEKLGFSSFTEAMDTGNPTGTGTMSPAERARQLGLQSDGSGGYIDPESGEVVARTVNGELVFYDNRGATGGVVSDGAGGQALANAQPSWSDPKTGMLTTPPAQPESPEEIAAVPDATPAVAPMGYTDFMKRKKEQAYAEPEPEQQEQPAEMDGGIPAMAGEIGMAGGMMGENYTNADLRKRMGDAVDAAGGESAINNVRRRQPQVQPKQQVQQAPQVQQTPKVGKTFQQMTREITPPDESTQPEESETRGKGFQPSVHPNPMHPFNQNESLPLKEQPVYLAAKALAEGRVEDIPDQLLMTHWNDISEQMSSNRAAKVQKALDDIKELELENEDADVDTIKKNNTKIRNLKNANTKLDDNAKLIEAIMERNSALEGPQKNNFLRSILFATHMAKPQAAVASKALSGDAIGSILQNKERISEVYGDGSTDHVNQNMSKFRPFDVSTEQLDDFIQMLKLMNGNPYSRFQTGGFESGSDFQEYFGGYDEDGDVIRGPLQRPTTHKGKNVSGAKQKEGRARALAEIFLKQGGYDPTTGLPLKIQSMAMDHFLGKKQGHEGTSINPDRDDYNNFIWINDDVNAAKGETDWPDVFPKLEKSKERLDKISGSGENPFQELEDLKSIESMIPKMYDSFINEFLEQGGGNLKRLANPITGKSQNSSVNLLNPDVSSEFLMQSFRNQEKLQDELNKLKVEMIDDWKEKQMEERGINDISDTKEKRAAIRELNSEYNRLVKNYQGFTPAGKLGRYILNTDHGKGEFDTPGMGLPGGLYPRAYFSRGGERYDTGRTPDFSGDSKYHGLYNAIVMKMVRDMEKITDDDKEVQDRKRREFQQEFLQRVEDAKSATGDLWKVGNEGKGIELTDGTFIGRHVGNFSKGKQEVQPLEGELPESPGTSYLAKSLQAYHKKLWEDGMLDEEEIREIWSRSPREMPILRQFITDGLGADQLNANDKLLFSRMIDGD